MTEVSTACVDALQDDRTVDIMFEMAPSLYDAIQATVRDEITSGLHVTQHLISLSLRGRLRHDPGHPAISFLDPTRSLKIIEMGVWPDLLALAAASFESARHTPLLLNKMTRPYFRFLSILVQNEAVGISAFSFPFSSLLTICPQHPRVRLVARELC